MSHEANPLALRLARQIEASGPISVAGYMQAANAAYYDKADPLGVEGDFITAPEISQMFGELVGMWLTDIWMRQNRPEPCHYVELGPGRGTLAADALRCMARFEFAPHVDFVEASGALRKKQSDLVPQARFHDTIESLPTDAPLMVVANEFFDALPVRQMISTHSGWRERVVVRDGNRFSTAPGTYKMDDQVPAELRNAPPDSICESSPEASAIMHELCGRLDRQGGVLLIIDYGYAEPALGSTLQAVKDHAFADPFESPGEHDLTAHVNFRDLANLGRMRDLDVKGPVDQGAWLHALGIDQRVSALAVKNPERADEILAARNRLTDPAQMGALFKVLAVSAPDWVEPDGFQ